MRKRFYWDREFKDWVERNPVYVASIAPMVWNDLPGYMSPCDSGWIEGRAARREDLKRHGCYEAGDIKPPGNGLLCESPNSPNYDPDYAKDYQRDRQERYGERVLMSWEQARKLQRGV